MLKTFLGASVQLEAVLMSNNMSLILMEFYWGGSCYWCHWSLGADQHFHILK